MDNIEITYLGKKIKVSINNVYNRLKVLKLFKENYKWYATCQCSCGKVVEKIDVRSLLSGNTKSCGCYNLEMIIKRNTKHGQKPRGKKTNRLYSIWSDMKRRCSNTTRKDAKNYSLKNITVCEEWNEYPVFKEWAIENGYNDTLTLERIDNTKGYSPENCKWIPKSEQSKNRTSNHYITYNGQTKTLTDWSKETGIPRTTLTSRLRHNWSIEDALTKPLIKP